MGEAIFYTMAQSQQKKDCINLSGLSFPWLRLPSVIQKLTKTLGLEHGAIHLEAKIFANSSMIDMLTALEPAVKVAQLLQMILFLFRAYFYYYLE